MNEDNKIVDLYIFKKIKEFETAVEKGNNALVIYQGVTTDLVNVIKLLRKDKLYVVQRPSATLQYPH